MIFIREVKSKRMAESEARLMNAVRSVRLKEQQAEARKKAFNEAIRVYERKEKTYGI